MAERTLIIGSSYAGAGRGNERLEALGERLDGDVALAEGLGEAERLAREAEGYERIVAAGGDGTVHEVLNGLMEDDAPRAQLGIVPLGTGNDVARNLGMLSVDDGVAAVAADHCRRIDVLRLDLMRDGRPARVYSLLNCGVGFGAAVTQATTHLVKRVCGAELAYFVGTLRALLPWRSPVMDIQWDGGRRREHIFFLAAGNGELEGGGAMRMSPGAQMDDGRVDVLLIKSGPKWKLIRNLSTLATGKHIEHPSVDFFPVHRLHVDSERVLDVQSDGDMIGQTPVTLQVLPRALEVCAPVGDESG